MSDFTDKMEQHAIELAKVMQIHSPNRWQALVGNRTNIKPWYTSRSAFKPGVEVALIGANPTGNPDQPPNDADFVSYHQDLDRDSYNAYLDESWDGARPGQSKLQRGVRNVFIALYGAADWDRELRRTACLNVCPLRTNDTSEIPTLVWDKSELWCRDVLVHLMPKLIICNGVGPGKSAWAALASAGLPVIQMHSERLGNFNVRSGIIATGDLSGSTVIGVPHLSRVGQWRDLPRVIASVAEKSGMKLKR